MTENEKTPIEPMTEERFGLECTRASLANMNPGSTSTLQIQSESDPKNDTKHALAYRCVVSCNGWTFETPYTTGKGNVPVALRETYRPSLGTVLCALFHDADRIEDHVDWVSWAEDLDYFSDGRTRNERIAHIRKAMSDFEACQNAHFFLRAVFGSSYERLMELSREV